MDERVIIDYTNYRGERRKRLVHPTGRVFFDCNEYHPIHQWLLEARCLEKGELRTFALKDIHSWTPALASV